MGKKSRLKKEKKEKSEQSELIPKRYVPSWFRSLPIIGASGLIVLGMYIVTKNSEKYQIRSPSAIHEQSQTPTLTTKDYDSIQSLDDLVLNRNYIPFRVTEMDENSAGSYAEMFNQVALQSGLKFPLSDLRVKVVGEISPLPNNGKFQELEHRLNNDLERFADYIENNHNGLIKIKKHKIVRS